MSSSSMQFKRPSSRLVALFWTVVFCCLVVPSTAYTESDRVAEYHKRNYTWPLTEVNPNTEGWRRNMFRRIAQVQRIEGQDNKYNAWINVITSAVVSPNFTEHGWGLTRAPADLVDELKASLHNGLATAREEYKIHIIEGELRPLFIPQRTLNAKVLETLLPMHEQWAGVPLTPAIAYGLRAYRNNSMLHMHVDKLQSHIISCILHVDHSEDSEPWPIFIEDFQGNTHEVILESGDMLFYESSKCIHGRPRKFNGSWYSSIFVHYYPVGWDGEQWSHETHYAIPPSWAETPPPDPNLDPVVMAGTSLYEPTCPDRWCGTKDSIKWYGPAKEGVVITTGYTGNDSEESDDEL